MPSPIQETITAATVGVQGPAGPNVNASGLAALLSSAALVAPAGAQAVLAGLKSDGTLARYRPTGNAVLVSSFGAPTGTDDTATIQAAYDAAVATSRRLIFDDPTGGAGTTWITRSTILDTSGALSVPQVTNIDTSTGVITFDRAHKMNTGEVTQFVGTDIGSSTKIVAYTDYYVRVQSSTTVTLYDTAAHANAGGATGQIIPNKGNTTTGVIVTLTLAANLTNGQNTLTVTDGSKVIAGDTINLSTISGSTVNVSVLSVAGNVLTLTANYSGSTVNSGTVVWLSAVDVANTLTMEMGTTLAFTGPASYNGAYTVPTVTSISGSTVHFNWPINTNYPTPGATQGIIQQLYVDPRYQNRAIEISGSPGVILKKHASFSGTSVLMFSQGTQAYVHDLELWGRTYGQNLEGVNGGNINPGDDGIRFISMAGVRVERCRIKFCGDSALRFTTSTGWPGTRSTTYPQAGVYTFGVVVRDNYILDCFQLSTTNSNDSFRGGAKDITYTGNVFENIGGSVKFANRVSGSTNLMIYGNVFRRVGRHGLELDSVDNYDIHNNTFENCKAHGIQLIANNSSSSATANKIVGFAFNDCRIADNIFKAGPLTTSSSCAIAISTDAYADGTLFDYYGLIIRGNKVYDYPGTPVLLSTGSYVNLDVSDNQIVRCGGQRIFDIRPRISTTVAGMKSNMKFSGNVASRCNGTKTTMFYIYPSNGAAGGPYLRGVKIYNNTLDGQELTLGSNVSNDGRLLWTDWLQDAEIYNNTAQGFFGGMIYLQTEGKDVTIRDNILINANTVAGGGIQLTNTDGVNLLNNRIANGYAGSAAIGIDRQCKRVVIGGNDLKDSANKTISIGNVPVKTSLDRSRREDFMAAAPTTNNGTWDAGDRYRLTAPAAGASPGGICTVGGSLSTINTTATSDGSTAVLTSIGAMTNLSVGAYVTHPGFTGTRKIVSMTATTITLDANSTSVSAGGALTNVTPTFKTMAALAA